MTPTLLADENIPQSVFTGLRRAGFDILAMGEHAAAVDDRAVLAHARQMGRWLLTFDGDFGELIFRDGEAPPPAVLYFRLPPIIPEQVLALAVRAMTSGIDSGFVVVTATGELHRPFVAASDRGDD
ncbi:MAG: DUF5615 family PIN-like protein [Burkholderiales bacterium]|nr:DUF5615 family PIN-like protein [Burkholderiales bacterium]